MMRKFIVVLLAVLSSYSAQAIEQIVGQLTIVEASYMPGSVTFVINAGSASCPAGKWLVWSKNVDSNKASYSLLLTAIASGRTIRAYVNDGDTSCTVQYLHIL